LQEIVFFILIFANRDGNFRIKRCFEFAQELRDK
jgi:hypothetical protein